jgi:hypothetical protein
VSAAPPTFYKDKKKNYIEMEKKVELKKICVLRLLHDTNQKERTNIRTK